MSDTQFRDTIKTLLIALGSNDAAQRQEAREKIRDTLAANRKSWNDLIAIPVSYTHLTLPTILRV